MLRKITIICLGLLLMLPANLPPARATSPAAAGTITVRFMPSLFKRLCVGDTLNLTLWTHWVEPPGAPGVEPLAPLTPLNPGDAGQPGSSAPPDPGLRISASLGSVSPETFADVYTGDHYFHITYTAQKAGTETLTAVVYGDLAQAQKTFEILDGCDYTFRHLGIYTSRFNSGDVQATDDAWFTSSGEFSVDRTSPGKIGLSGSGSRSMIRIYDAVIAGLTCDLPRRESGAAPFTIGGTKLQPSGEVQLKLDFSNIVLPVLEVHCTDAQGNASGGSSLIPQELGGKIDEEQDLTFPAGGGGIAIGQSFQGPPGSTILYQANYIVIRK